MAPFQPEPRESALSIHPPPAPPAAFVTARGAMTSLGALLTCADPAAWGSLARPSAQGLGQIVLAIRDKYDEGLSDLGVEPITADAD